MELPTLADLWATSYQVEHRRFHVRTEDGVRIAGVHLDRQDSDTLVIYLHGFLANKNHMRVPRFVEALSARFDVMAIDLRGHGESGGGCSFGAHEVLDIQATVEYARSLGYERITTIGSSMGGASVIRHAALYHSQDGVVTIGAFADPQDIGRPGSDYGVQLLYNTGRLGELWSYVTRGTRLDALHEHEPALELVGDVAPIPLLLIHGEWDATVHPRSAELLYENASEPKELVIIPRGGHDYPHLTEETIDRIQRWMLKYGLDEPKE
ncbi:MAG: alpha/beta hydrolase [Chloroflexota bacterium]|nr:alpha/beta hydrolase [Chloroflexota bacterium]